MDTHPLFIEKLRVLYNSMIPFLATHPIKSNGVAEQQMWWKTLDHSKVTVHLYSPVDSPWEIAAFSMVTDRGAYCTPMFAIDREHWGKGYGDEIIHHYLRIANGKPLFGEQLVSNGAIRHLNARAGWQILGERNGVQSLYHPNRQQEIYDEIVRYSEEGVNELQSRPDADVS